MQVEIKKALIYWIKAFKIKGEQPGLNRRPSVPQTDALPAELCPPWKELQNYTLS